MPLIELEKLTKDYGSFRAIDDLSLQIYDGVTGLLGPNGAGKTSMIRIINQIINQDEGEIFIDEKK